MPDQQGPSQGPSFTLEHVQQLYGRLASFRESDLEKEHGGEQVVEMVREITEALVWGEKHDSSFFDFFCEKNILGDFIRVLSLARAPKTVKVQLLQTLSMLVQNIRREQSLFYLLSNHQVNRLICMPLDFNDEEILAYWITLLKSLAMRLDDTTINFFFIARPEASFPLYSETTKFFNHKDQMVRATVRTITLRVYKISFEPMRAFVQQHAEESYFSQLALHLKSIWLQLNEAATGSCDAAVLQHENDLQQDLLIYLSDVFELGVEKLNRVLADRLLDCVMVPLLLLSLDPTPRLERLHRHLRLAPSVALFLLRQVFELIRRPELVQPLAAAVLHQTVPEQVRCVLPQDSRADLRGHFLGCLRGREDATFLFAVGIVHGVMRNRQALPLAFLQEARICPMSNGASRRLSRVSEDDLDILWSLLRGLQTPAAWRPETLQILVGVIADVFADEAVAASEVCCRAARLAAEEALALTAAHMQALFEAEVDGVHGGARQDDLLDAFTEEWEAQRMPVRTVSELCAGSWHVLLPPKAAGSGGHGQQDEARRATHCFLLLRRLLRQLSSSPQGAAPAPPGSSRQSSKSSTVRRRPEDAEDWPNQVDEASAGAFQEGLAVPLGDIERVPCSVLTVSGTHARCLLLHDAWLLLARTDGAEPGSAIVTTRWPLQQVQGLIDRGDPRILQLGMQAGLGGKRPGEALVYSQPAPKLDAVPGGKRGSFFTLVLMFEDVCRCHVADAHLRRRCRALRAESARRVLELVQACSAQLAAKE